MEGFDNKGATNVAQRIFSLMVLSFFRKGNNFHICISLAILGYTVNSIHKEDWQRNT